MFYNLDPCVTQDVEYVFKLTKGDFDNIANLNDFIVVIDHQDIIFISEDSSLHAGSPLLLTIKNPYTNKLIIWHKSLK